MLTLGLFNSQSIVIDPVDGREIIELFFSELFFGTHEAVSDAFVRHELEARLNKGPVSWGEAGDIEFNSPELKRKSELRVKD